MRVSRETVGSLGRLSLIETGLGWTGAGSLYARPTPFARGGIDAAALNRRAVVVFELRLRVKWSN